MAAMESSSLKNIKKKKDYTEFVSIINIRFPGHGVIFLAMFSFRALYRHTSKSVDDSLASFLVSFRFI